MANGHCNILKNEQRVWHKEVPMQPAQSAGCGKRSAAVPRSFACEPRQDARFRKIRNDQTRREGRVWSMQETMLRDSYPAGK
jgi:hypothetical protein